MKEEFYLTNWKCKNCDACYIFTYTDKERKPKEMTLETYFKQKECPICGCRGAKYSYGGTCQDDEEE